jgi:hypothetical protein
MWGEHGKEILEILIDKYNAGEKTQYDLSTMHIHEYTRLPFGTWVAERKDVVPVLKMIFNRIRNEWRLAEARMDKAKEAVQKTIEEKTYNEFGVDTLRHKLEFDYLVPELRRLKQRYAWFIRLAEGKVTHTELHLEDIKKIPIATVLGERESSRRYGERVFYKCPLHNEKTESFCWYSRNNSWYCFGACGVGGDVIDLYQKLNSCDFKTAIKEYSQ